MEAIKNVVNQIFAKKPSGPKIRYAVVGGGWISQGAFMPGVGQTSNSVMTALVSGDPDKLELATKYNLKFYSYNEFANLLDGDVCDAVYIATPNWMHKQFAVPALEKGYHVLLEKPMEISVQDSLAIQEAAKKSGAKLMVAYRLHCEPGTLEIIDRVRRGDIGDPRIFSSVFIQNVKADNHRAKHGFEAGPIPDMGPYPINAVRSIFGSEPIEVSATGTKTPGRENLQLEFDTISVILKFPHDRVAHFTVGYSGFPVQSYQVVGTKGVIEAQDPCYLFGPGVKISYKLKTEDNKDESKQFPETDQFGGETDYFSDCILNDRDVEPDGEEGILDVRVIEAVKNSLSNGGQVQKLDLLVRSKRPALDQARTLSLAPQPKEWIGRDSQPPSK